MNWVKKHKFLSVVLVIIALFVVAGVSGGKSSTSNTGNKTKTADKNYRFTDRADKQKTDQEVLPGESATIDGVKLTVTSINKKDALSDYQTAASGKTYVVAMVQMENIDSKTHPYNSFNFKIQTVGGTVLDETLDSSSNVLNSGDLVAGGKVSGEVAFEVPVEQGHDYLIWKPNAFSSDRAVIQVP